MNESKRIALFGGSFDPVHAGHLKIAESAMAQKQLDEVRFIPCQISPHKTHTEPTPGEHRLAMLKLATRDLPWAVVDDYELHQDPPSYSYLTVREIRRQYPEADLMWIMGVDQWDSMLRWAKPEELREELEFLVFSRDGLPEPREGWKMQYLMGTHPASSTEIRKTIKSGKRPQWLDPAVLEYIESHGLYRG